MRTTQVQGNRINQSVDQIKNMQFSFIVDNTLYPYPSGAYSYSPITIDVALQVSISISPNYEILGNPSNIQEKDSFGSMSQFFWSSSSSSLSLSAKPEGSANRWIPPRCHRSGEAKFKKPWADDLTLQSRKNLKRRRRKAEGSSGRSWF